MTVFLSPSPKLQFIDANGNPYAGGKLYTYAAGTTTLLTTYTDSTGLTQNSNPIILDTRGECSVWLSTALYKYQLTDANDVAVGTPVDNISAQGFTVLFSSNYTTFSAALAAAAGKTLIIDSTVNITDNVTVPATVELIVWAPGIFVISSTKTLTINGPFSAGIFEIFSGSGLVVFGEGAAAEYYPEWWFNTSSGEFGAATSKCLTATKNAGAKIVFTKSHTCTTPINATSNQKGWVIEGRGGSGASPDWGVTIAFGHTGVGFDCSASEHILFQNFKYKGGALGTITSYPSVGFLFARNAAGSGCGKHSLINVQCAYGSKFDIASIYNYGAEEMVFQNCHIYNFLASKQTVVLTAYNLFAMTSSFLTLGTGVMSTTVMKFTSGAYWATAGASSSVFFLDSVSEISVDGPLLLNDGGYSLFYISHNNGATVDVSIKNIRDEGQTTGATYGINFGAGAFTPLNFCIEGNVFRVATNVLYADDTITPQQITYRGNIDSGAKGISVKSLTNSDIDNQASVFTGRAGGTILGCDISGNFASMTFNGAITGSVIRDYQYNSLTFAGNGATYNLPVGTMTLTANAGSTTLTQLPFIKAGDKILLTPTSATAAADVGSATGVYVSAIVAATSFTVTHPNNANTDKTFNYMIFRGA